MLTEEILRASKEYKDWIGDSKVSLVHNCYYDAKEPYGGFIVIHTEDEGYSITRFFEGSNGNRIHVSCDYKGKTADEVFQLLLSEYSMGLN